MSIVTVFSLKESDNEHSDDSSETKEIKKTVATVWLPLLFSRLSMSISSIIVVLIIVYKNQLSSRSCSSVNSLIPSMAEASL